MIGYGNSMFLATNGILARPSGGGVDPDAQAFITAAAITNPTQQSAINQLVVDLKGYNIWTKMQTIYPMVGGTNSQHTWNLKNTAQFQISWQGGVTSSANGVQFNGMNSYGITGYNPSVNGSLNSHHLSFYSRTQSNGTEVEFGSIDSGAGNGSLMEIRTAGTTYFRINNGVGTISFLDSDSRAFYIANRTASNVFNGWRNSTKAVNGTLASSALGLREYYLGAFNNNTVASFYTTKQCAFASIGSGLTDTEAANLYTSVQAFQTTLGRSIGTQTVSDADAQAFVTNAGIVDQVEANAVNNLVIGLKADSLWTKMKAVYPFVGGTASQHKFNLKDPRDLDAAFRLVFNGGWTHSANGALPNGTNAFADTFFNPIAQSSSLNSFFMSVYSRTNSNSGSPYEIANGDDFNFGVKVTGLVTRYNNNQRYIFVGGIYNTGNAETDSRGFYCGGTNGSATQILYKNGTNVLSGTSPQTGFSNCNLFISAINQLGTPLGLSNKEVAFISIMTGLSSTDVTNFNNRIQTFQTTLGRQV